MLSSHLSWLFSIAPPQLHPLSNPTLGSPLSHSMWASGNLWAGQEHWTSNGENCMHTLSSATHLMWQQDGALRPRLFLPIQTHCQGLRLGSHHFQLGLLQPLISYLPFQPLCSNSLPHLLFFGPSCPVKSPLPKSLLWPSQVGSSLCLTLHSMSPLMNWVHSRQGWFFSIMSREPGIGLELSGC